MSPNSGDSGDETWDPVSKIPLDLRGWGSRSVLRDLVDHESWWRERVGDEPYEKAVEYWREQAQWWP